MPYGLTARLARWYNSYVDLYADEGRPPPLEKWAVEHTGYHSKTEATGIFNNLISRGWIATDGRPLQNPPMKVDGEWLRCPACGDPDPCLPVHGHVQCRSCHAILERCCDD